MAVDITSNPDLYKQVLENYQTQVGGGSKDPTNYINSLNNDIGTFASQFENFVGRSPTQDEIDKFTSQFIIPHTTDIGTGYNTPFNQTMDSNVNQFLTNNFGKTATDYATQQLAGQQDQASSLANLFRTQGNQAISDTEQSLLDYQSKLFDRLRPSLITSLKAQGLLDTGGMNEALAGQQGDLANAGANYIAQLKLQNENAANQIAFSGAAAPYNYKQGVITNQPNLLVGAGQQAIGNNFSTFMDNLNYQHSLGLIDAQTKAQQSLQPSFMRTFSQSFGSGLGTNLSAWTGPGAGQNQAGSSGNYASMAKLFA